MAVEFLEIKNSSKFTLSSSTPPRLSNRGHIRATCLRIHPLLTILLYICPT